MHFTGKNNILPLICFLAITIGANDSGAVVRSHLASANTDPRVVADLIAHPELNAIGMITNEGGDVSTAFIIDECYILTSRHSAFHDNNHPSSDSLSVFHIGHSMGKYFWSFDDEVDAVPIAWGNTDYSASEQTDHWNYDIGEDWAVLRLEKCLGEKYGFIRLHAQSFENIVTKKLINLSQAYMKDSKQILWDRLGHVREQVGLYWKVDNAVLPGDSGGPVFIFVVNSGYEAVALISSEDLDDQGQKITKILPANDAKHFNNVVPIGNILDRVRSAIDEDKKSMSFLKK